MITGELAERVDRLTAGRIPFAVATVVRARQPTSVRPGDSAVVLADGTVEGFVGGDCARASVRLHALRSLETGEPVLLRLIPGDLEDAEALGGAAPEDAVVVERNPCLSGGSLEIFLEPRLPAPLVMIVGDSPIAHALERIAAAGGYYAVRGTARELTVAGATAVVVASHGADEERVLVDALTAGVPYVALVASRRRGEAVRASLDVPDELRAQLHTPAGLDIGARTPAEIAIAILAGAIAERRATPAVAADAAPATAVDRAARGEATDPVCGMRVAVTDATPRLGDVYFCSEHCREAYARQQDVATA